MSINKNMDRKRLLIVDDEPSVLDGLRRILYRRKDKWKIEFVSNARDALSAMRNTKYDIVISDLKMPGMNGVVFVEKVKAKYPDVIRFMLSGYNDKKLIDRAMRSVHRFIAKPCPSGTIEQMIDQAFALRSRLYTEKVMKIINNLRSLPVMPSAYQKVIELIIEPGISPRDVGKAISQDIGMTTKLLQVVNSGSYGLRNKIADPIHAVTFLGLKTVEGLILSEGVFSKLDNKRITVFGVHGLQEHCVRVGALARKICNSVNMSEDDIDVANMAGLMHDAGKIVMISKFHNQYFRAIETSRQQHRPLWDVEREFIDISHAEIGGCLLELWGLPNVIIEAATYHHDPWNSLSRDFTVLSAVYIADVLDHMLCCGTGDGCGIDVNYEYLQQSGLIRHFEKWSKVYLPDYARENLYV